ncbi:hypothetical protein [Amycolatopsis sp. cmx-11-51]|uniref:hypothetical protein n=1 Tax=unclassified Amycolatopsis TaxID=2618356 RepID=UPI0039E3A557
MKVLSVGLVRGFLAKLAIAFVAIFLCMSSQQAFASPMTPTSADENQTVACENWIKIANPYRDGKNITVHGEFRNCGAWSKVCVGVNYFHVIFPGGGQWVPLGKSCSSSTGDYLTILTATGGVSYTQAQGWITGFDHSGRPVSTKTSPVVIA